ncbi:MAG: efflux transporter periplasmic adaptor subunit [Rhodospirillales bacterium]|nr:efflux transporter periplasmic adaptor subunit [Rhodospirillales bacterium]
MIKRMGIMLVAVGVVFGGIFAFQTFKASMIKHAVAALAAPPQTVATTTAGYQEWQPQLESVGSLRAVNGANLSLEVAGIVDELDFKSGDDVKEGTPLLRLQAKDDIAKLQSLQATAALAKITYDRDLRQSKAQAVSQQTVDTDQQTLKSDVAQVAQQQALVDYKSLVAPFAGRLGIRQVDLGQYLAAGTTVVTLQALDPIYLDFYLPQQALGEVKVGQPVTAKVDTYPSQSFSGEISAVNPQVDTTTRNVQIRATLKNRDHMLLPGMFATLDIAVGAPQRQVTLPQTAITFTSYGNTVYIVEDKGKKADGQPDLVGRQTFVTTGATRGDQVAVLSGVKEGDVVVTAGQIKLHNGSPLAIDDSVKPTDDADPHPVDHL